MEGGVDGGGASGGIVVTEAERVCTRDDGTPGVSPPGKPFGRDRVCGCRRSATSGRSVCELASG